MIRTLNLTTTLFSLSLFLLLPVHGQQTGAVTVNFSNLSNQPVQLSRIPATVLAQPATSFQGAATPLGVLPAGNRVSISSLPGDIWNVTGPTNQVVAQFQTTADPKQVFTITQDQVGPGIPPGVGTSPLPTTGTGSKLDNFLRNANRILDQVSPPNNTTPPAGFVPPAGTNPPSQPPATPTVTGEPTTVTLTNVSPTKVTVAFINQQNQLQPVGEIPSNMAAPLSSQSGQRLVFLDPSNQSVGAYTVTNAPGQTYTIGQVGSPQTTPAPAANTPSLGNAFNPPQTPVPNQTAVPPMVNPAPPAIPGNQAQIPGGATGSNVSLQDAQDLVNYHNEKRREVGSPPVVWSEEIARYAQSRAETIARTRQFTHLPQGQNPYGENLASAGTTGGTHVYTAKNGAEDWYKEKQQMPQGAKLLTRELFSRGVGHYTQMVWKGSTEIGAGTATYEQNGFTMTVIVCCYNPPGNVLNQPIF